MTPFTMVDPRWECEVERGALARRRAAHSNCLPLRRSVVLHCDISRFQRP
jgi:hypothetical protein